MRCSWRPARGGALCAPAPRRLLRVAAAAPPDGAPSAGGSGAGAPPPALRAAPGRAAPGAREARAADLSAAKHAAPAAAPSSAADAPAPGSWAWWTSYFEAMDDAVRELDGVDEELAAAVAAEDYAAAAALRRQQAALEALDAAGAARAALAAALAAERYADAAATRDAAGAGLPGWWVGRGEGGDAAGHLLRVTPDFGRYVAHAFSAANLAELAQWSDGPLGGAPGAGGRVSAAFAGGRGGGASGGYPFAGEADGDAGGGAGGEDSDDEPGVPVFELFLRPDAAAPGGFITQAAALHAPLAALAAGADGPELDDLAELLASEVGAGARASVERGVDGDGVSFVRINLRGGSPADEGSGSDDESEDEFTLGDDGVLRSRERRRDEARLEASLADGASISGEEPGEGAAARGPAAAAAGSDAEGARKPWDWVADDSDGEPITVDALAEALGLDPSAGAAELAAAMADLTAAGSPAAAAARHAAAASGEVDDRDAAAAKGGGSSDEESGEGAGGSGSDSDSATLEELLEALDLPPSASPRELATAMANNYTAENPDVAAALLAAAAKGDFDDCVETVAEEVKTIVIHDAEGNVIDAQDPSYTAVLRGILAEMEAISARDAEGAGADSPDPGRDESDESSESDDDDDAGGGASARGSGGDTLSAMGLGVMCHRVPAELRWEGRDAFVLEVAEVETAAGVEGGGGGGAAAAAGAREVEVGGAAGGGARAVAVELSSSSDAEASSDEEEPLASASGRARAAERLVREAMGRAIAEGVGAAGGLPASAGGVLGLTGRVRYERLPAAAASSSTDPFTGVFLGSFGPHGPEALALSRVARGGEEWAQGRKLTGDPNVPAGEVSFRARVDRAARLPTPGDYPPEFGVQARYAGQGRVAREGFAAPKWVDGELLVFSRANPLTAGAELGFVYNLEPARRFLLLFTRVDLAALLPDAGGA
jgi:hypothetical protein